jgi:hypothetical protein
MRLQARILHTRVTKNQAFDERTGNPNPSYFIEATVLDTETNQTYRCVFKDTPEAKRLSQAYRDKWPEAKRDALAAEVETKAKQQIPENEDVTLIVYDINKEGPTTLLVRKA